MPTIKCPKCSTHLKVAQQAAAVKVKCPNCATVLKVPPQTPASQPAPQQQPAQQQPAPQRTAAPAKQKKKPPQPAPKKQAAQRPAPQPAPVDLSTPQPTASDDPFAMPFDTASPATPLGQADASQGQGAFDFGNLDLSTQPDLGGMPAADPFQAGAMPPGAGMPAAGMPVGNSQFPAPATPQPQAPAPRAPGPSKAAKRGKSSKKLVMVIGIAATVLLLLTGAAGTAIYFAMQSTGSARTAAADDSGAAASGASGGQAGEVGFRKFYVALPDGEELERPPAFGAGRAVRSATSNATYFIGVDEFKYLNMGDHHTLLRAGTMVMADVMASEEVDRGGQVGFRGKTYGGLMWDQVTLEVYHVGDQIAVFGCVPPEVEQDADANEDPEDESELPVGPAPPSPELAAEMEAFFASIRLPPAPSS